MAGALKTTFGHEGGGGYGRHVEIHLLLMFTGEGGSGYGSRIEISNKTASCSHLGVREVADMAGALKYASSSRSGTREVVRMARRRCIGVAEKKNYLPLAFGREGGSGGGQCVETWPKSRKGGGSGNGVLKPR